MSTLTDHYEIFDSPANALRRYDEVLELDNLYTVSLSRVIKSTDHGRVFLIVAWSVVE